MNETCYIRLYDSVLSMAATQPHPQTPDSAQYHVKKKKRHNHLSLLDLHSLIICPVISSLPSSYAVDKLLVPKHISSVPVPTRFSTTPAKGPFACKSTYCFIDFPLG